MQDCRKSTCAIFGDAELLCTVAEVSPQGHGTESGKPPGGSQSTSQSRRLGRVLAVPSPAVRKRIRVWDVFEKFGGRARVLEAERAPSPPAAA